jgi:hypothetical protein
MTLKHDPYQILRKDKSPFGLYARKKWLLEGEKASFQDELHQEVSEILRDQKSDGSWDGSIILTAEKLFHLHLTIRERNDEIERALLWLYKQYTLGRSARVSSVFENDYEIAKKIPFMACEIEILLPLTLLFLTGVFNWEEYGPFPSIFFKVREELLSPERNLSAAERCNFLRAYIIKQKYQGEPFIQNMLDYISRSQTQNGDWGPEYDFYLTLNGVAHSGSAAGNRQLKRAYPLLVKTQNSDGSWGNPPEHNPVFATFLTIHTLQNRGLL